MSNNATVKEHPLAHILRAIADGFPVQGKWESGDWWDFDPYKHTFASSSVLSWRIKPEEVVEYTAVYKSGSPGAQFFKTIDEASDRYYPKPTNIQGLLKRTTIDGKVVKMEFIPK